MYSPFGMNTARRQAGLYSSPYQPQNQQQSPYDFKGLENRLGQIETGIAGLTDQFKNWDRAGQETVDPEYTGNNAPDPLTPAVPTGGISSLPEAETTTPDPVAPQGPPQPISMADWVRDYEFDFAPQMSQSDWDEMEATSPQGQGHGYGQHRMDFMQNWQENNPEYQRWKEREAGRDPISQETQNIMWGGQHPLGGPSIIPYAQQGKSYEDYMNMVNEAKSQYAETPWLFDQGIQPPEGWKATGNEWQGNPFIQSLGAGIGGLAGQQRNQGETFKRNQGETFGMSIAGPGGGPTGGTDSTGFSPSKHNAMMQPGASSRQSMVWTSPGHPSYTPLSEETYQGQVDLWKGHEQFQSLRDAASHHLGGSGMGNAGMYRGLGMGTSGMGRAFEAWNQFNQSQAGGPYTAPPRQHIQSIQHQENQRNLEASLNNPKGNLRWQGLGAGIGALTGPTQQKIQGYMT